MGSKSDLRGLNMERVHELLKKYGNPYEIENDNVFDNS